MVYTKVSDDKTYKSWVQLELEASRVLYALENLTGSMVVADGEPEAPTVLFFDTGITIENI